MAEEFGDNPFRKLDSSLFPDKDDNYQKNQSALSPEDRDLFLRSWERTPARKASGFPLADFCALPALKKMKKKTPQPPPAPPAPRETEADIFFTAMRNTAPLTSRGRRIAKKPELRPPALLQEQTLADFMAGKLEFAVSFSNEYLEGHVVGMDEGIMNRLREGQFSAEASLDLHGLNSAQAFEALRVFIRNAWLKDLRSVLVVTGRGHNSPDGQAVLRQKLQTWLTKEPFKRVVLGFCTAKPHDGGPGSIYVLLRRFRKKGRIHWERMFVEDDI